MPIELLRVLGIGRAEHEVRTLCTLLGPMTDIPPNSGHAQILRKRMPASAKSAAKAPPNAGSPQGVGGLPGPPARGPPGYPHEVQVRASPPGSTPPKAYGLFQNPPPDATVKAFPSRAHGTFKQPPPQAAVKAQPHAHVPAMAAAQGHVPMALPRPFRLGAGATMD